MRLLPLLTILVFTAAPVLAAEGGRAGSGGGEAPVGRSGCGAMESSETVANGEAPRAAPRRVTRVCATVPDRGCGPAQPASWLFRADGRPLRDWRAGCSFRTQRDDAGTGLG